MLLRVFAILLALVLVALNVVLRVVSMRRSGVDPGSPYAFGYLVGGVLVLPALVVGIAAIWRSNRAPTRLLMAANIGLVVALLGAAGGLTRRGGPTVHKGAAAAAKFRSEALGACREKCARNPAALGVAPDRCEGFCTCAADQLLEVERAGGSKEESAQAMRRCVSAAAR